MSFAKIILRATGPILPGEIIIVEAHQFEPLNGYYIHRGKQFSLSARPSPECIAQMQTEVFQARLFSHASLN